MDIARATVAHDGAADSIAAPAAAIETSVRISADGAGTSQPSQGSVRAPRDRRFALTLKRSLVAGALLIAAGLVAFYVFRPPAVTVGSVTTRDVAPAIQGVGTVEAKGVVNVSSKATGRVLSVLVDQGDTIRAGQVLVRIDAAQYAADVDRLLEAVPPLVARAREVTPVAA